MGSQKSTTEVESGDLAPELSDRNHISFSPPPEGGHGGVNLLRVSSVGSSMISRMGIVKKEQESQWNVQGIV